MLAIREFVKQGSPKFLSTINRLLSSPNVSGHPQPYWTPDPLNSQPPEPFYNPVENSASNNLFLGLQKANNDS